MRTALAQTPEDYRALVRPIFLPQALLLGLVAFAAGLPLAPFRRAYRIAAPAAAALTTVVLALDARVHDAVGFHLNGFFLRVLLQPNALAETGVPAGLLARLAAGAAAFVAADVALGAWFVRRFASPRPVWRVVAALLALSAAERVYGALLVHFGGPAVFAASGALPLQPPVRMGGVARRLFGEREQRDPFAGERASRRPPPALPPEQIALPRRPDVLFVVAESLPAEHLDARTMPRLWARAEQGARFTRHYASASATNYAIFSLVYGMQAQKLEAVVGSGRRPLLFPALTRNGYESRVLAASCVDWMELEETVFAGVPLETWCASTPPAGRDAVMLARAREVVEAADPDRPLFLFLFFFGTHFTYFPEPEDEAFSPAWDGKRDFARVPAAEIRNRARNAARGLDRQLDAFLQAFEARRGPRHGPPLVLFTGDHSDEFREKGHLGHGSAVTREQLHVPFVVLGEGVPRGVFEAPTSHVDLVPTLLTQLGDAHPPRLYSDGLRAFDAPMDRFVVSTVGWEPRHAVIGADLKVSVWSGGAATVTDPDDRPLPDGDARFAARAGAILRALRGELEVSASAGAGAGAPQPAGEGG
jgi:membrane-anchored protein YejM (alkaline phosphatase superfamily)